MARIRTIKPEFCSSRDTGALSRDARLFFLQLLTEADDTGRLQWIPRRLAGVLYPHDDEVTPAMLRAWADECAARGMLLIYTVDGSDYIAVCNWSKHQKVDHAAKSRLPDPPETVANDSEAVAKSSRDSREGLAPDLGTGNREQGEENAPPAGDAPPREKVSKRKRSPETTLAVWLDALDGDAIPADDSVFDYAEKIRLPADFLHLAWSEFEARHLESGKRYRDWRQAFRKCVRENWYRLWWESPNGWALTTTGVQAQKAAA